MYMWQESDIRKNIVKGLAEVSRVTNLLASLSAESNSLDSISNDNEDDLETHLELNSRGAFNPK